MSVQITLNFATAAEAAAAMNRLAGAKTEAEASLAQPVVVRDPNAGKPATETASPKPKAETTAKDAKPTATAKTEKPADTPASAGTGQTDAPAKGEAAPLEYEVLQKAVFKLASKDKAQIPPLLAKFGVTHFKEVPAEKRAEALAAVNEVIAQLEVA